MIEIVCATRHATDTFWTQSPLGLSLKRLSFDTRLKPHITFRNQKGLPEIYNCRISSTEGHDLLVFLHDDVWIDDFFLADHVIQGLREYDIIGVAGNRRRVPDQPAWAFIDDQFTRDSKDNLSGSVAHGATPFGSISHYGDVPADCELLDGVFWLLEGRGCGRIQSSSTLPLTSTFTILISAGQREKKDCDWVLGIYQSPTTAVEATALLLGRQSGMNIEESGRPDARLRLIAKTFVTLVTLFAPP